MVWYTGPFGLTKVVFLAGSPYFVGWVNLRSNCRFRGHLLQVLQGPIPVPALNGVQQRHKAPVTR